MAAGLTAGAMMLLYQATVIDSRSASRRAATEEPSRPIEFVATAYCKGHTTKSGVAVTSGVAAADPAVLPLGSIVQIDDIPEAHRGIYTVLDTGPKVKGRHLDLYIWSCYEALDFGRRTVTVTVLRRGWKPNDAPVRASSRRPVTSFDTK